MIGYDKILFFDTETTGIPGRDADWKTDYETFPRICQLSWILNGREENHIIRPDGWEIPQEATDVHGITTERALTEGEPLVNVIGQFIEDCHNAELICGHNLYFDTSTIKSELMRYGMYDMLDAETALFKGKRIDTMRPSMKWVGATFSNGRLKFPKLEELYARCFPGETFPAHDAICDVRAVARCLPVLVDNGIITLAVKEYPAVQVDPSIAPNPQGAAIDVCKKAAQAAETMANFAEQAKKAGNGPISDAKPKDDKLHVESAKGPQIENSAKITDAKNDLVAAMMADDNF